MRLLKRLGVGLLIVVLVLAALWAWSRLRGPTAEQREALVLLEAPNAFEGRNAFDALWVLRYDVPEGEVEAVVEADMAALAAASADRPILDFPPSGGRYPPLPSPSDSAICSGDGSSCLLKVRADLEAASQWKSEAATLVNRVQGLSLYDHLSTRTPARSDTPIPPLNMLSWPITANAVEFVSGDPLGALEATCRDLDTFRRLGVHSDLLITRMVMIRYVTDGYGKLIAAMLGELPRDVPLPDSCKRVLVAPTAGEASVCQAIRGEFALSMHIIDMTPDVQEPTIWTELFFDRDHYRALTAESLVRTCASSEQIMRDTPIAIAPTPFWQRLECIASAPGCILADIASPAYQGYANQGLDYRARLQLLATLAWLRDQPDVGTLTERLARRPDGLRSPARDITVGADGRSLEIAQYDTRRGDTWSLPLPPYLVESPAASD